jgi:benzoyl-CoA reductase/2-hydroxyglutaryl-CoA dehydratase subunit BcrC/BadD/HgdB
VVTREVHFESEVKKWRQRVKRIEEDPDITKLKSNKYLYELFLEEAEERLDGWRRGKPFCDHLGPLTKALGFCSTGNVEAAFATGQPKKYLAMAAEMGLPVGTSCDMSMMPFAMVECGDLPMLNLNVCEGTAPCTPMKMRSIYIMYKGKGLSYPIDIGIEHDEANFNYMLEQLHGFIDFAERIPGIKYSEDRLIELQGYEEAGRDYCYKMFELLKTRPTPIAGKDSLRLGLRPTQVYTAKAVEAMQARYEELAERVAKGIAAVPGEKARVIWTMTNPVFMDVFKVLAGQHIAVLTQYEGEPMRRWAPLPRKEPEWLDKYRPLKPLEKLAAQSVLGIKTAKEWVDSLIWVCQQLGVEGIINYNMVGCTEILGIRKLVEEKAQDDLGIPVLQLEGKQWDENFADEKTITGQLNEFAALVLSNRSG